MSIPKERLRLASSSSSSVSDFLPKLRNLSRSFLLKTTSSPSVSTSALLAVEGTHGKIHISEFALQELTHVKDFFVKLIDIILLRSLKRNLLVAEEHE